MNIVGFSVGPLQANAYLAISETGECAVVDPGAEPERLLDAAADREARIELILLTHAHLDHVGAVGAIHEETGASVYLHPGDRELYDSAPKQAESFGIRMEAPPTPDAELQPGSSIRVGGEILEVRHTPGHAPGHVCLVGDGFAFVGDCVFAGSIGRTDLPGGDLRTLLESIRREILTLPDTTVLYPGHGPETTVGRERKVNPFLTGVFE